MQKNPADEGRAETLKNDESWLSKLGPGLVTGAADDDPSGIATYSQSSAQFGYAMLWTMSMTVRSDIMGQLVVSSRLWVLGWVCTGVMTIAVGAIFFTMA